MTRLLVVWHWLDSTHEVWPDRPRVRQTDCVVAATSKAAAARAFGEANPRRLLNLAETWNAEQVALAMSEPGTVFWRHLDRRDPAAWKAVR